MCVLLSMLIDVKPIDPLLDVRSLFGDGRMCLVLKIIQFHAPSLSVPSVRPYFPLLLTTWLGPKRSTLQDMLSNIGLGEEYDPYSSSASSSSSLTSATDESGSVPVPPPVYYVQRAGLFRDT